MAIVDTRTGNEVGDVEPCTVTATRAEFVAFVEKHHVILTMPEMTKEAFEQLMEAKELAGHQVEKDRGTLQSTTIDMIRDGDDELADWFTAVCQPLPKAECSKINCVLNINSGRKSGKGWHKDNPTEGTKVTGDDWDRGERVTGTEGSSARRRNPTRVGPMSGMPGLQNKRNQEVAPPNNKITGSSGSTDQGSLITVSGGARG